MTAEEVNNGNCDRFGAEIQERLRGIVDDINEDETCLHTNWESSNVPGHFWLEYNGWFYDSECPEGVDEWTELPIFKRFAESGGEIPV